MISSSKGPLQGCKRSRVHDELVTNENLATKTSPGNTIHVRDVLSEAKESYNRLDYN